ncbi:MAG TPA: hypothetical protein DCW90_06280 [Lachnospiraceae bacterium]|nr:ABC transporter ATP-binding protein [uncultured Lachnoclostridium sp.]HAU85105.1 hypothetical protein [Lachnospiraceae bacterium]
MKKFINKLAFVAKIVFIQNHIYTLIYILGILLSGLAPVIQLYILNYILRLMEIALTQGLNDKLVLNGVLILVSEGLIFTFIYVIDMFKDLLNQLMIVRVNYNLQEQIINKLKDVEISAFEDPEFYDNYYNASEQSQQAVTQIVNTVTYGASILISTLGYLQIIANFHLAAMFIVLISFLPNIIFHYKFQSKKYQLIVREAKNQRKLNYYYDILAKKEYVKESKIYPLHNFFETKRKITFKKYYEHYRKINSKEFNVNLLLNMLGRTGRSLCIIWMFIDIVHGNYDIAGFATFFNATSSLDNSLKSMVAFTSMAKSSWMMLDFFMDFLQYEPRLIGGEINVQKRQSHKIVFEHVWFRYQNEESYALKDISLEFNTGELTVILGMNGSGKSTLLKLLLRLYDPQKGSIFLDDNNIKNYKLDELYSIYSVIFQDFNRYSATLYENLTFSIKRDLNLNHQYILDLLNFLDTLSEGVDTELTQVFEEGSELSGGQWQRVALSRMLLKDADIMILDEPTSALDTFSENYISNLLRNQKNKMIVCVTHKLFCIEEADNIVFLEDGELISQGKHSILINSCEQYRQLYNLQFGNKE